MALQRVVRFVGGPKNGQTMTYPEGSSGIPAELRVTVPRAEGGTWVCEYVLQVDGVDLVYVPKRGVQLEP